MIAGDGTVSVDERVESSFADITTHVYADGDDVYQNQTVQGQSTYSTFSSPYYRTAALPSTTVAQQLVLGTYAVSMVEQTDAGTLVTLTATGTTESTIQDASIENLSGTLVVDLSGTIRSFSTSYEVTAHGQTTAIEIEYTVERRNVEPVEPSAWVETATERSTTADLRYVSEEDVLAIEHAGGDSVAAGTHIVVTEVVAEGAPFGNPESLTAFSASLDDVLSPGETAYIYQPVGLSDAANVTIGERPDEEAAHLPATVLVQVVDVYTNEIVDVTEVTTEDDS